MTAQQDPATRPAPWPRAAVSAAIFRDGRVLIAERAKGPMSGVWSLPGGHVEAGETTRVAALRELREETAVEATLDGLVDVVDVIRHDGDGNLAVHYILTVFHGTWRAGEPVADVLTGLVPSMLHFWDILALGLVTIWTNGREKEPRTRRQEPEMAKLRLVIENPSR